ncbi:hypothetical protein ACFV4G_11970 [Kitasatospora sp. NPDC059747]|uniref:hypothetical protein n=1 Tax=Kitasatospora sp. NPDC059747 TaxID=3346930 RepID=UPI00366862D0
MNSLSLNGTAAARRKARAGVGYRQSGSGSQRLGARASKRLEAALEAGWLAGNLLGLTLLGLLVDHQLNRSEEPTVVLAPSAPDTSFTGTTT